MVAKEGEAERGEKERFDIEAWKGAALDHSRCRGKRRRDIGSDLTKEKKKWKRKRSGRALKPRQDLGEIAGGSTRVKGKKTC